MEKPKTVSVSLSNKDKKSLEEIAREKKISQRMLAAYAVRYFLANYRLGKVQLNPVMEGGKAVLHVDMELDDGGT